MLKELPGSASLFLCGRKFINFERDNFLLNVALPEAWEFEIPLFSLIAVVIDRRILMKGGSLVAGSVDVEILVFNCGLTVAIGVAVVPPSAVV